MGLPGTPLPARGGTPQPGGAARKRPQLTHAAPSRATPSRAEPGQGGGVPPPGSGHLSGVIPPPGPPHLYPLSVHGAPKQTFPGRVGRALSNFVPSPSSVFAPPARPLTSTSGFSPETEPRMLPGSPEGMRRGLRAASSPQRPPHPPYVLTENSCIVLPQPRSFGVSETELAAPTPRAQPGDPVPLPRLPEGSEGGGPQ